MRTPPSPSTAKAIPAELTTVKMLYRTPVHRITKFAELQLGGAKYQGIARVLGLVCVMDIEWDQCRELERTGSKEFAVYLNRADQPVLTSMQSDPIQITLNPSSFEIFSFVPIRKARKK